MTKEELERERAQASTSSLPPRPVHTVAPSIPPQTDDIDTDWGVESEALPPVPPKAAAPMTATATPVVAGSALPVSPVVVPEGAPPRASSIPHRASSIPPGTPAVIPSAHPSAPPPAPVVEDGAPRHIRIGSRTLIGTASPPTPPVPPVDFAPMAPVASTRPAALIEPVVARTTAPHELRAAHARPHHVSPTANEAEPAHSMRVYAWLAAAAVVVAGLAYVRLHRSSSTRSGQAVAAAPTQVPASPVASAMVEPIAASPSATAEAPASAATMASSDASSDAPAASSDAPADSAGMITITVNSKPPNAQFFHFGKQVGTAPFVVQLKPGEHHAYEVGLPGHITRKLVLDGSKTELTVGLREEPR